VYQVVQEHLETWLAHYNEAEPESNPVPHYIERDLRKFLECGILARGFARAYCDHCGRDFLIAYSCKGRGICPSCNSKRMAAVAAHLVDEVFPCVPVRQWVISFPKRLRYFLLHNSDLANRVIRIAVELIEHQLIQSARAPDAARIGAVFFLHHFGSSLNAHLHFHFAICDGVFYKAGDTLHFAEANVTVVDIAQVQEQFRKRILALFVRRGLLDKTTAQSMAQWAHGGGFSINGAVRIGADDRRGLERLLRYCARPLYAAGRLQWIVPGERLRYRLAKPGPSGETELILTPFEFIDRIAQLMPAPRRHRHRYFGVFAPNAPLRKQITACAGLPIGQQTPEQTSASKVGEAARGVSASLWAMLLARIYEVFPLICPYCGSELRILTFITDSNSISTILTHLGLPAQPPRIARAHDPPWEIPADDFNQEFSDPQALSQEPPEFEYDQRINW
jgi:hypothetical protein